MQCSLSVMTHQLFRTYFTQSIMSIQMIEVAPGIRQSCKHQGYNGERYSTHFHAVIILGVGCF